MANIRVRDIRTLPFYWIHRALIERIKPSIRGLVAYNALAYFASAMGAGVCKEISIPRMAAKFSVSEDTIKRGLRELVEKKAIISKERYKAKLKGKREQLPNEYILIDLGEQNTQTI